MKILCLIDNLGSGGAQRQMMNLSILWKKNGHEIIFACYGSHNFYEQNLSDNGIRVNWIQNKNFIDRIVKVRKFIKKVAPNIVVSFLETPNFLGCVASIGKHPWKLITNERSASENSFIGLRAKIFKKFEEFSDWTVCNSNNAQRMWETHCPQFANRISTIYNPVRLPTVSSSSNSCEPGKRRIVVAASYQVIKNPLNVIEAISKLDEEHRNKLQLDWYGRKEVTTGNSEIAQQAEKMVAASGLEHYVTLHDETKNIYDEMANASAVALFSRYEGLPNAICEGMTLGKPILMSRVSDYRELVTENNGFLCNGEDPESIKDAIVRFLDASEEKLCEMGKNSKEMAKKLFSQETVLQQWEQLFDSLIKRDMEEDK